MFAFVVPGQAVQQTTQVPESPERFVASGIRVDTPSVDGKGPGGLNHLMVFMTGVAPFPDGWGATIHLELPGKGWCLLGALSNSKPSAMFRLRQTLVASASASFPNNNNHHGTNLSTVIPPGATATLGILCEPAAAIETQLIGLKQQQQQQQQQQQGSATSFSATGLSNPSSSSTSTELVLRSDMDRVMNPVEIAQKVATNLFNHLSGFVQPLPNGQGSWVEFGVVEKWYRSFERKLKTGGAGFLLQND